jgi:hypothetical protein
MPNPTKLIVDCSTGVTTEVELTDEEVAQQAAEAVKAEADRTVRDAEEAAKAAAKASAEAKLSALGLTAEEVAALTK